MYCASTFCPYKDTCNLYIDKITSEKKPIVGNLEPTCDRFKSFLEKLKIETKGESIRYSDDSRVDDIENSFSIVEEGFYYCVENKNHCYECPYYYENACTDVLLRDAYILLKKLKEERK